jgi:hypothetical protein
MKNLFLTIMGTLTACSAQNQLSEGKVKGRRDSFKVHHVKYNFTKQADVLIYSDKNKYNNGIPYGKNEMELGVKDVHIDQALIKKIMIDVLHDKLNLLHKHQEKISGILKFDLSGNVTDVGFSICENSIITIAELETIDNRLRAELKATYTGKAYLTHVAISGGFENIVF